MAKKLYEETKIAAIATKIREKTGTEATYTTEEMPSGVEEVFEAGYAAGAEAGASGGNAASIIDRSITEITDENVTVVGDYAFYACEALWEAVFPNAVDVKEGAFFLCPNLITLDVRTYGFKTNILQECTSFKAFIIRDPISFNFDELQEWMAGCDGTAQHFPIMGGSAYMYIPTVTYEEYLESIPEDAMGLVFRKLEDYTVDGTSTGELDPDKI